MDETILPPHHGEVPEPDLDLWPCPRLSPHPPHRSTLASDIDWTMPQPLRLRVVDHTCSCRLIVYELLCSGGQYVIRRMRQTDPPEMFYAGPWRREVAERVWKRVLTGEAG
jgi:hypothetical protein